MKRQTYLKILLAMAGLVLSAASCDPFALSLSSTTWTASLDGHSYTLEFTSSTAVSYTNDQSGSDLTLDGSYTWDAESNTGTLTLNNSESIFSMNEANTVISWNGLSFTSK